MVGPGPDRIPFLTVVCTYDSLDKIRDAQHTGRPVSPFDLAIMDEAHRIAGRGQEVDGHQRRRGHPRGPPPLHDRDPAQLCRPRGVGSESASLIRPRRHRPAAALADASANSMNSEAVYGKKIFEYPLATAIADGRAADYRIVVPTITDADLRAVLNLPHPAPPVPRPRTEAPPMAGPERPRRAPLPCTWPSSRP